MRTCDEYIEMISAMIDGELSEADTEELSAHLSVCSSCRCVSDAFLSISECLETVSPPPGFTDNVMSELSKLGKPKKKYKGIFYLRRAAVLAACIGIIVFSASKAGLISSYDHSIYASPITDSPETIESTPQNHNSKDTSENSTSPDIAPKTGLDNGSEEAVSNIPMQTDASIGEAFSVPDTGREDSSPDSKADTDEDSKYAVPNSRTARTAGGGGSKAPEASDAAESYLHTGTYSSYGNPVNPAAGTDDSDEPLRGISDLHNMEYALVYSGTSEDEIVSRITDADALYKIADLLAWKEYPKSDFVLDEPVYTLEAKIRDGDTYVLRIWSKDNLLYCAVDNSGVLFMAAGVLTTLNESLGLTIPS